MAIVVEVLNRAGFILHTHRFERDEISIGRSFDNDLILHDPHVDAQHLSVTLDHETTNLHAQDLQSLNGAWLVPSAGIARTVHLKQKQPIVGSRLFYSGQTFLIGRTILRVFFSGHVVPKAIPLSPWESFGYKLAHWWVWGAALVAVVVFQSCNAYLNNPVQKNALQYVLPSGYVVIGALMYAGLWAFVGRNLKHEAKFSVHFSVALLAALVLAVIDTFLPIAAFNFKLGWLAPVLKEVVSAVVVFGVGVVTLIYATAMKPFVRGAVASIIPTAILLSLIISLFTQPEFRGSPRYETAMVSPSWQWRSSNPPSEFMQQADGLYAKADASVSKSSK